MRLRRRLTSLYSYSLPPKTTSLKHTILTDDFIAMITVPVHNTLDSTATPDFNLISVILSVYNQSITLSVRRKITSLQSILRRSKRSLERSTELNSATSSMNTLINISLNIKVQRKMLVSTISKLLSWNLKEILSTPNSS